MSTILDHSTSFSLLQFVYVFFIMECFGCEKLARDARFVIYVIVLEKNTFWLNGPGQTGWHSQVLLDFRIA